jgi:hypothetical protein
VGIQFVATVAGIAALEIIPKKYESTTTIRMEKSQLVNPLTRGAAATTEMEDRLRGIREEILSRDYFDKIIARLSLEPQNVTPLQHEELVQQMMKQTRSRRAARGGHLSGLPSGRTRRRFRMSRTCWPGSSSRKPLEQGRRGGIRGVSPGPARGLPQETGGVEPRCGSSRKERRSAPSTAAQLSRIEQLRATLIEVKTTCARRRCSGIAPPAGASGGQSLRTDGGAGAPMVANPQAQLWTGSPAAAAARRLFETYPDVAALKAEIVACALEVENPTVAGQASSPRQPSVRRLSLGSCNRAEIR